MSWGEQEGPMTDSRRHRGRGRRIVVLAALGLLAGTAWLLPARSGSPSPAVHARAGRQTGHMPATPTHLARQQSATPRSTRRHVARTASPQLGSSGPGIPVRLRIPALGLLTAVEP